MPAPALVFGFVVAATSLAARWFGEKGRTSRARQMGHKPCDAIVRFTCAITPEGEEALEASGGMPVFLEMARRGRYIETGI